MPTCTHMPVCRVKRTLCAQHAPCAACASCLYQQQADGYRHPIGLHAVLRWQSVQQSPSTAPLASRCLGCWTAWAGSTDTTCCWRMCSWCQAQDYESGGQRLRACLGAHTPPDPRGPHQPACKHMHMPGVQAVLQGERDESVDGGGAGSSLERGQSSSATTQSRTSDDSVGPGARCSGACTTRLASLPAGLVRAPAPRMGR